MLRHECQASVLPPADIRSEIEIQHTQTTQDTVNQNDGRDFAFFLERVSRCARYYPLRDLAFTPKFALKTNLLFDLATIINAEIEVSFTDRWSIAAEFMFPWWLDQKNQYCLQLFSAIVEGKYWFGKHDPKSDYYLSDKRMLGWFAGLYVGGGLYDIEWGGEGIQGEFFLAAGVSGGYAHRIARNLRMEYSLGIGFMQTDYRRYIPIKGGEILEWQNNGRFSWIGPTRAKVSLVWIMPTEKWAKQKGAKR